MKSLLRTDIYSRAPMATQLLEQGELTNDLNLRWASRVSSLAVLLLCSAILGVWWWRALWIAFGALMALLFGSTCRSTASSTASAARD